MQKTEKAEKAEHHSPYRERSWPWHLAAGLFFVLLALGIWFASKQVDYNWNWQRVPQYLVSTEGQEVRAPFDGTVAVSDDGKSLTLTPGGGGAPVQFKDCSQIIASNGDQVTQDDLLARKAQLGPGPLVRGLGLTLEISAASLVFSVLLGFVAGIARISRNPAARDLATVYVEVIRGTPLLVQIFIVYFFIGSVLQLSAFWAGVTALSVFTGAYVAEIVRAGIQAVPKGQTEAAQSLGLSGLQTLRHVILPQATRRILPPLAGQFINLIKDSSLVSIMALTDLTKAGREVVSSTFSPFEVWFTVAAMYLLLTGSLSLLVRRMERRLAHE